ncbi:MAG: hypothetical protein KDI69_03245 [Xanthomonadales bacterium]|nr:hypothetical protein [Xanthomonadales bacterium]
MLQVLVAVIASLLMGDALAQSASLNYYVRVEAVGKTNMIQSRANIAWDAEFVEYCGGFRYVFSPTRQSDDKKSGVMTFQIFLDKRHASPDEIVVPLFTQEIPFDAGLPRELSFKDDSVDIELSFVLSDQR